MTSEPPVTLASLTYHWGDAYMIHYTRDRWTALRRDTRRFLTADTLDGLETAIRADYRDQPVPRDFDLPGLTSYLNPDNDGDAPDEGEEVLEEDTLILLMLRSAFPRWKITHSPQLRAWTAQTPDGTICENSPALLCLALTLIERKERQARNGPGWNWPPWGKPPPS